MSTNELERLSVIQKIVDKHLMQVLAAKQLGLTDRQVRRLVKSYKLYGAGVATVLKYKYSRQLLRF
jgi:transcriptional regulator with GAF, ATPase, and Fis domain